MKAIFCLWMCCMAGFSLQAQTFSEWFRQKKTQIKYLQQQIVALAAFTTDLEKGYGIIQKGTGLISRVCQDDLAMHSEHFSAFGTVSPAVRLSPRVQDILSLQQQILANYQACPVTVQQTLGGGLLTASSEELELLHQLLTDGHLQLTDAARLQRIEAVYEAMGKLYRYSVRMRADALIMLQGEDQERKELELLRILYGIN